MHPPSISGPPVAISAHMPNRPWKSGLTILGWGDQQARINSKWNARNTSEKFNCVVISGGPHERSERSESISTECTLRESNPRRYWKQWESSTRPRRETRRQRNFRLTIPITLLVYHSHR
jgi:hypothetical protein